MFKQRYWILGIFIVSSIVLGGIVFRSSFSKNKMLKDELRVFFSDNFGANLLRSLHSQTEHMYDLPTNSSKNLLDAQVCDNRSLYYIPGIHSRTKLHPMMYKKGFKIESFSLLLDNDTRRKYSVDILTGLSGKTRFVSSAAKKWRKAKLFFRTTNYDNEKGLSFFDVSFRLKGKTTTISTTTISCPPLR